MATLTLSAIRKMYNGTSLTKHNITNLYNRLNSSYKKNDYKQMIVLNNTTNIHEILYDQDKSYHVRLNILEPNTDEISQFPRYINLLEGKLDIITNNSKLRLIKGGILLDGSHKIQNACDKNTCVIISHTDMSNSLNNIALL